MSTTGETIPDDSPDDTTGDITTDTPTGDTKVETTTEAAHHEARLRREGVEFPDKPEGPIAAAILAGGIGCFTLGLMTTLAEASTSVHDWLELTSDVGPLSGKTIVAVVVWLVAWAVLHLTYRDKPLRDPPACQDT